MQQDKQAPGQVPVAMQATRNATQQQGALDRDLFCPRLQRLLLGAASELGQRGNLAQVVSSIERGGVGGGGEDPNLGMLRRLGATETRGIDNRVSQLRELDHRFRGLQRARQATALAHYQGTPRAHHTLQATFGHGQGGLAGVVLYRWQLKQSKLRDRNACPGLAKVTAEIEATRAVLLPLELDAAADPGRLFELEEQLAPLRATLARLCAQQAALAAVGAACDDEQALVDLCRGKLDEKARGAMVDAAATEVRGLHRDWYATGKRAAKAWVEEATTA